MTIVKTSDFNRALTHVPAEIKQLYHIQEKRFQRNWRDPRLHIKKNRELLFAFSFRVTRRYRVFFYFQNEQTAVFFEIDHRKDVYK